MWVFLTFALFTDPRFEYVQWDRGNLHMFCFAAYRITEFHLQAGVVDSDKQILNKLNDSAENRFRMKAVFVGFDSTPDVRHASDDFPYILIWTDITLSGRRGTGCRRSDQGE